MPAHEFYRRLNQRHQQLKRRATILDRLLWLVR